jgi:cytochrome c-type biogenesis protein CcmE
MANVDDELREAVRESEAAQAEPAPVAVPVAGAGEPRRPKRNLGLLVALLVAAASIVTLMFATFEGTYSKKVEDVVRDRETLPGRNLRVEGTLKRCTLVRRDEPCEYRFTMASGGKELPVRYARCTVPDTFQDVPGMVVDVTAEGTLSPNGEYLEASTIMAKCPSKYEMKERAMKGEQAPHLDPNFNKPCI